MELRSIRINRETVTAAFNPAGSSRQSPTPIRTEYILEACIWLDLRRETIVHRWDTGEIPDHREDDFIVVMQEILSRGSVCRSNNLGSFPILVDYVQGKFWLSLSTGTRSSHEDTSIDGILFKKRAADRLTPSATVLSNALHIFGSTAEKAVCSTRQLNNSLEKLNRIAQSYGNEFAYELNFSEQQPGWWLEIAEPIREAISAAAQNAMHTYDEEECAHSFTINVEDYECRDVTVYCLYRSEVNRNVAKNINELCITIDYSLPQNRMEILTAFRKTRAKVGGRRIRLKPSKK